jgi:excisionase family DNA binding protein
VSEHGTTAPAANPGVVYRVSELAALLKVDINVIYRDVASGRIDAYRVGKGRGTIRIPEAALRGYKANAITDTGQAA